MKKFLYFSLGVFLSFGTLKLVSGANPVSSSIKEIAINGYRLTFEILPSKEFLEKTKKTDKELAQGEEAMLKMDKSMTHHFAVTIKDEKTGKEITDATVKVKVITPKKEDQIKTTMNMTNHFCHYFKLAEKGKYEILYWVKIKDKDFKGGFYW